MLCFDSKFLGDSKLCQSIVKQYFLCKYKSNGDKRTWSNQNLPKPWGSSQSFKNTF